MSLGNTLITFVNFRALKREVFIRHCHPEKRRWHSDASIYSWLCLLLSLDGVYRRALGKYRRPCIFCETFEATKKAFVWCQGAVDRHWGFHHFVLTTP